MSRMKTAIVWMLMMVLCLTGCSGAGDENLNGELSTEIQEMVEGETQTDDTNEMSTSDMASEEDEKIPVGTDYNEFMNAQYEDVVRTLTEAGFTNITTSSEIIEYDADKEGCTTDVRISGISDFSAEDKFDPDDEIIIYYMCAETAKVPDSCKNLIDRNYEDVEKMFLDAGFTNVITKRCEADYDENKVSEGSVISISIGDNTSFNAEDEFYVSSEVKIDYRVKPVETPKQTSDQSQESGSSSSANNSSGSGNESYSDSNASSGGSTGVTVPEAETGSNLVWVPVNGGTKYHTNSGCSGMKDPIQVTEETAIANGYTPCKRCH